MNNIGKNIKKARKSAGLTQEQLAYSCGISSTAVRHWEAGRHKPSREHLHIIARECDVTVEYILHNMDEKDIAEVIASSKDILHNFTIAKAKHNEWECIQPLSLRGQNKYQSIISALAMCGYTPETINDIDNFFEFMNPVMESVKNSIELYMQTLNKETEEEKMMNEAFTNLREARTAAGLTQEQLATILYVERQTISNIETGRTLPSLPLARAICDTLHCTWDIFFNEQLTK